MERISRQTPSVGALLSRLKSLGAPRLAEVPRLARSIFDAGLAPEMVATEPAAIVLQDLTAAYGATIALEAVSGRFEAGSLTAVVGANGAGKTTLLNVCE